MVTTAIALPDIIHYTCPFLLFYMSLLIGEFSA